MSTLYLLTSPELTFYQTLNQTLTNPLKVFVHRHAGKLRRAVIPSFLSETL